MDTWDTPYNLVRSVKLELIDGSKRREYRLFELNQAVLVPGPDGKWRAATRRSVHCEYGRIGSATRLHDWTSVQSSGAIVSNKYDELLSEKVRKGYEEVDYNLAPAAVPSLERFGLKPGKTSSGRSDDDYLTLADAYLTSLDEGTRDALVDANAALYRALLGSAMRPAPAPAQSLCLLMLAERAVNAQFYVDHVLAELASGLDGARLLAEASPAFGQMMDEPGCDMDLKEALARLSVAARSATSA